MKTTIGERERLGKPLTEAERADVTNARQTVDAAIQAIPGFPLPAVLNSAAAEVTECAARASEYARAALAAQHKTADAVSRVKQLLASKDRIEAENLATVKRQAHAAALKKLLSVKYDVQRLSADERTALEWVE